jgi:hypothetical protein
LLVLLHALLHVSLPECLVKENYFHKLIYRLSRLTHPGFCSSGAFQLVASEKVCNLNAYLSPSDNGELSTSLSQVMLFLLPLVELLLCPLLANDSPQPQGYCFPSLRSCTNYGPASCNKIVSFRDSCFATDYPHLRPSFV